MNQFIYTTFETKELVRASYCEAKELGVCKIYFNSISIKKTIIKKYLKAKCKKNTFETRALERTYLKS